MLSTRPLPALDQRRSRPAARCAWCCAMTAWPPGAGSPAACCASSTPAGCASATSKTSTCELAPCPCLVYRGAYARASTSIGGGGQAVVTAAAQSPHVLLSQSTSRTCVSLFGCAGSGVMTGGPVSCGCVRPAPIRGPCGSGTCTMCLVG